MTSNSCSLLDQRGEHRGWRGIGKEVWERSRKEFHSVGEEEEGAGEEPEEDGEGQPLGSPPRGTEDTGKGCSPKMTSEPSGRVAKAKEQAKMEMEQAVMWKDVAKRVGNHIETIWFKLNAGRMDGGCDLCGGEFNDNKHFGNGGRKCYTKTILLGVKEKVKERIENGDLA